MVTAFIALRCARRQPQSRRRSAREIRESGDRRAAERSPFGATDSRAGGCEWRVGNVCVAAGARGAAASSGDTPGALGATLAEGALPPASARRATMASSRTRQCPSAVTPGFFQVLSREAR